MPAVMASTKVITRGAKKRLGQQRGAEVARVEVARALAQAICWMFKWDQLIFPGGPQRALVT